MSSFWASYNQAYQQGQNRRAQKAQAFEQFRKSNPQASYEDWVNELNRITGGRPGSVVSSEDILRSQYQEAQRVRNIELNRQRAQEIQAQQQINSAIDTYVEQNAMFEDNDLNIMENIAQQFGPGARAYVNQRFPKGFSGYRERARAKMLSDYTPTVTEALRRNPDADLGAMFPSLPPDVVTGLRERAQGVISSETLESQSSAFNQELQRINSINSPNALRSYQYIMDVDDQRRPQLDAYKEARIKELEDAQSAEFTGDLNSVISDTISGDNLTTILGSQGGGREEIISAIFKSLEAQGIRIGQLSSENMSQIFAAADQILGRTESQRAMNLTANRDAFVPTGMQKVTEANKSVAGDLTTIYTGEGSPFPDHSIAFQGAFVRLAREYDLATDPGANGRIHRAINTVMEREDIEPYDVNGMAAAIAEEAKLTPLTDRKSQLEAQRDMIPDRTQPYEEVRSALSAGTKNIIDDANESMSEFMSDFQEANDKQLVATAMVSGLNTQIEEIRNNVQTLITNKDMVFTESGEPFNENEVMQMANEAIAELERIKAQVEETYAQHSAAMIEQQKAADQQIMDDRVASGRAQSERRRSMSQRDLAAEQRKQLFDTYLDPRRHSDYVSDPAAGRQSIMDFFAPGPGHDEFVSEPVIGGGQPAPPPTSNHPRARNR
jgi:hypothetical protein